MPTKSKKSSAPNTVTRNLLVAYHGGGYPGCFWEWNAFWLTPYGSFLDIYSSGRNGIDNIEDAKILMAQKEHLIDRGAYEEVSTVIADAEEVVKFMNEQPASLAVNIIHAINEWCHKRRMRSKVAWKCEICEDVRAGCDAHGEAYQGMGGIAYAATKVVCQDCESSHSCYYCGEFWEDTSDFVNGYCEFCAKTHCTECEQKFREEELQKGVCSVCRTIETPDPNQPSLFEEAPHG